MLVCEGLQSEHKQSLSAPSWCDLWPAECYSSGSERPLQEGERGRANAPRTVKMRVIRARGHAHYQITLRSFSMQKVIFLLHRPRYHLLLGHIYHTIRRLLPHLIDWLNEFSRAFQEIRIKREEGIQRVCVSGHRISARWTAHHWQQVPVVSLNDGVTEDELVLPGDGCKHVGDSR